MIRVYAVLLCVAGAVYGQVDLKFSSELGEEMCDQSDYGDYKYLHFPKFYCANFDSNESNNTNIERCGPLLTFEFTPDELLDIKNNSQGQVLTRDSVSDREYTFELKYLKSSDVWIVNYEGFSYQVGNKWCSDQ
ncbi:MAG: hypothetical protein KDD48_04940 [Bdellovibrionales bacterium]|nr:hypothetical protein [Bdellovibrionales bacterium]